jgi:hypothetical protein
LPTSCRLGTRPPLLSARERRVLRVRQRRKGRGRRAAGVEGTRMARGPSQGEAASHLQQGWPPHEQRI